MTIDKIYNLFFYCLIYFNVICNCEGHWHDFESDADQKCVTEDNAAGVCVPVYHCSKPAQPTRRYRSPVIEMRGCPVGDEDNPMVCCPIEAEHETFHDHNSGNYPYHQNYHTTYHNPDTHYNNDQENFNHHHSFDHHETSHNNGPEDFHHQHYQHRTSHSSGPEDFNYDHDEHATFYSNDPEESYSDHDDHETFHDNDREEFPYHKEHYETFHNNNKENDKKTDGRNKTAAIPIPDSAGTSDDNDDRGTTPNTDDKQTLTPNGPPSKDGLGGMLADAGASAVNQPLRGGIPNRPVVAKAKCQEFLDSSNIPFPVDTKSITTQANTMVTTEANTNSSTSPTPAESSEFIAAAVGGKDAERDSYPHMALLGYGPSLESAEWLCGGSVVSDMFILTAAHCLSNPRSPVTIVALGILKRSDPPTIWQTYRVRRIIPFPLYQSPSKYHDIALLETSEKIQFNENVLPACLDTGDADNARAYATGWGALGSRSMLADTLQTVNLNKFADDRCLQQFPEGTRNLVYGYDSVSQMCYGDTKAVRDTCAGDSGGPLQVRSKISNNIHLIIGVTSFGDDCGVVGNPGVYTRVSYYLPWIESEIWP